MGRHTRGRSPPEVNVTRPNPAEVTAPGAGNGLGHPRELDEGDRLQEALRGCRARLDADLRDSLSSPFPSARPAPSQEGKEGTPRRRSGVVEAAWRVAAGPGEPLRGALLEELLHDHQRGLREAASRHEAGLRQGAEAVLEALRKELAALLRETAAPQEDRGLFRPLAGSRGEPLGRPPEAPSAPLPLALREPLGSPRGGKAPAATGESLAAAAEEPGPPGGSPRPAAAAEPGYSQQAWHTAAESIRRLSKGVQKKASHSMQREQFGTLDDHAKNVVNSRDVSVHSRHTVSSASSVGSLYSALPGRVHEVAESFLHRCGHRRDEPYRKGFLADLAIRNMPFKIFCNLVIFANSAILIYTANRRVHEDIDPLFATLTEGLFTGWYIVELILNLTVHRSFYFTNEDAGFNVLDLVLILMSVVELSLILWGREVGVDSSFLRSLRIFKVAKFFRMFRALRIFHEIHQMMECVVQSMGSLLWAMSLLAFLLAMFAIFFVQSVASAIENGSLQPEEAVAQEAVAQAGQDRSLAEVQLSSYEAVVSDFGSVQAAMFSLLQASSGGQDWIQMYNRLEPLGAFAQCVFIFYIVFMLIAVMNIVTSIFLDKAMHVAQPTVETMMINKYHQDMKDAKELTELVSEMDTQNSGAITFRDFMSYMQQDKFRLYFEVRGLNVKDTAMFFKMLSTASNGENQGDSNADASVDLKTFVTGCMRLKGVASCMDLYTLSWEIKCVRADQKRILELSGKRAPPRALPSRLSPR